MAKLIKYLKDLPKDIRYEFLRQNEEFDLESTRFVFKGKPVKGTLFHWKAISYLIIFSEEQLVNEEQFINNDYLNMESVSDMMGA